MHLSLVQKIVSNFVLQSFKTSELRKFQTKKVSQLHKHKVCWSETIFSFWSNSNLRHILDYESISVLIESNLASIRPFFTAHCPSK